MGVGRCNRCGGRLAGEARDPETCTCPVEVCAGCGRSFSLDDEGTMYQQKWYCDKCDPLGDGPGESW